MSQDALSDESSPARRHVASVTLAYCALGMVLCWSRLVGLSQSFWHDEIVTVRDYIRPGPGEILFGDYIPNNHELFSLLGWASSSVIGESEIALRLWSVIPFIVGAALVTGWLHTRIGALTAVLYLLFVTLSPLLLDLSRQARGYGLAFLAMSAMIVAALEADRTVRYWAIPTFCFAGVVGTLTLPIFVIAFLATGGVLLADRSLRARLGLGLAVSTLVVTLAWYAPHADDLLTSSQQEFGAPIPWFGIVTAPIDQILIPALLWVEGLAPTPSLVWLPPIAAIAIVLVSSPLLRDRRMGLILGSGVVVTLVVVFATRLYLAPRVVSFLLVPLFILLSSGTAHVLARTTTRVPGVRAVVAVTMLALVTVQFASSVVGVTGLPREAHKDVAELIERRSTHPDPVFVHSHIPTDLAFYLRVPQQAIGASEIVSKVCDARGPVVYVMQPFLIEAVDVPCLSRSGVDHYRFRQYTRGDEINVWFIPPES